MLKLINLLFLILISLPVLAQEPTATPTPEVIPAPEVSAPQTATPTPESSVAPEVTPTPEIAANPDSAPVVSPDPEVTPTPVDVSKTVEDLKTIKSEAKDIRKDEAKDSIIAKNRLYNISVIANSLLKVLDDSPIKTVPVSYSEGLMQNLRGLKDYSENGDTAALEAVEADLKIKYEVAKFDPANPAPTILVRFTTQRDSGYWVCSILEGQYSRVATATRSFQPTNDAVLPLVPGQYLIWAEKDGKKSKYTRPTIGNKELLTKDALGRLTQSITLEESFGEGALPNECR